MYYLNMQLFYLNMQFMIALYAGETSFVNCTMHMRLCSLGLARHRRLITIISRQNENKSRYF